MADIFVSYARSDRDRVEPLVALLEEQGWSVWWDREIGPGASFRTVIEREIEAAHCVIVAWTRSSVDSDWVNAEASEALARKVLLPVLLEEVQLPLVFRQTQCCDLSGWPDRADPKETLRLLEATGAVLERPVVQPPPLRRRRRTGVLAAGLGAALLAVVTAGVFFALTRPPASPTVDNAPASKQAPAETVTQAPLLLVQPFEGMEQDIAGQVADRLLRSGALRVISPQAPAAAPTDVDARVQGTQTGALLAVSVFDVRTQRTRANFRIDTRSSGLRGAVDEIARRVARAFDVSMDAAQPVISEEDYLDYLALRAEIRESPNAERRSALIAALEDLTRRHPRFAEGFATLCDAQVAGFRSNADVGAFEEAEGRCNRAMRLDPDNPWVAVAMGSLYRAAGQLEEAKASYETALDELPYLTNARVGLARVAADEGDLDRAGRLLETAIEQEPYNWGIRANAAMVWFEAGRYREAADAFEEAVRLSNGTATMLNDLGSAYFMLGEQARAVENWEKSAALDPNPTALTNLGSAYYFEGDFSAAVTVYEQAARMQEDDYRLWINAGDAAIHDPSSDAGPHFERAVELAEEVWRVNPDAVEVRSALALANASLGRAARARELLEALEESAQLDVYARYDMAAAWIRLGEEEAACSAVAGLLGAGYPGDLLSQDATFAVLEAPEWCD